MHTHGYKCARNLGSPHPYRFSLVHFLNLELATMAPVATNETPAVDNGTVTKGPIKALNGNAAVKLFNPFYSPPTMDENDGDYKFAQYKV